MLIRVLILGCSILPVILNLHYFQRDSYIVKQMSGLRFAVEGRNLTAVAHLAFARSQNTGNGIIGIRTNKRRLTLDGITKDRFTKENTFKVLRITYIRWLTQDKILGCRKGDTFFIEHRICLIIYS